jgi:heme-degrading monooxygenase HmoA
MSPPARPALRGPVYTRWTARADFEAWQSSQAFESGHKGASRSGGDGPAATGSSIWGFEVVTEA